MVDGWHAGVAAPGVEGTAVEGDVPVAHVFVESVEPGSLASDFQVYGWGNYQSVEAGM